VQVVFLNQKPYYVNLYIVRNFKTASAHHNIVNVHKLKLINYFFKLKVTITQLLYTVFINDIFIFINI